VDHPAVLVAVAVLEADPGCPAITRADSRSVLARSSGSTKSHHGLADHFVRGIAEDAFAGGIDVDDVSRFIDEENGVEEQADTLESRFSRCCSMLPGDS
jgi:hypothetical protein